MLIWEDYAALPYKTDGRPVVKVGVKFDAEKPVQWIGLSHIEKESFHLISSPMCFSQESQSLGQKSHRLGKKSQTVGFLGKATLSCIICP